MASLHNNIRLYPWYRVAADIQAWIPVFFLYFSQIVAFTEVIKLAAIYYVFVCLFEVPSGYFSDRVGRRTTLIISAISAVIAYSVFLVGGGFMMLAVGQVFLSLSVAMQSGCDTALHYDSLLALGKQSEFAQREAQAEKYGHLSMALSALAGGLLALMDLRLAYVLALLGAFITFLLTIHLVEPLNEPQDESQTISVGNKSPNSAQNNTFTSALVSCLKCLREPVLMGLFLMMAIMYCLAHIPFEFYQAYLKLLNIDGFDNTSLAPLISGAVISVSMFGGALAAAISIREYDKFGLGGILLAAFLIQLIIIAGLAYVLHWSILALIFLRNFGMSLIQAPVHATIAPRVPSQIRSTYLSLQSLTARLIFSGMLYLLSISIDVEQNLDWTTLSSMLQNSLLLGLMGSFVLIFYQKAFRKCNHKDIKDHAV